MADDDGLLGRVKRKLVDSKQAWAREGRLLTGRAADPAHARLPPGQREVRNWPVLDLGVQPEIDLETWELVVDGAVENPVRWRWEDFRAQRMARMVSDIHCVTAWSRYDNRWDGVAALDLLAIVRPRADARHVVFHSYDGYTTNLELAAFADADVILAHAWEGKPLTLEHGGPVRVVVPKRYFWKSAKWVRRVEFTTADKPGFWETRGYHNEADPWKEERYG
jgi:DMSO/TMAO reductase YedYZ molybdopterin-dependent catalytic subunit